MQARRILPAPASLVGAAAAAMAALPWLNPFAVGPSAAVAPWLVSMAFGIGLFTLAVLSQEPPPWRSLLAVCTVAALLVTGIPLLHPRPEVLMLVGGVALVLLGLGAGRTEHVARGIQAGLLIAAALSALIGLLQYFGLAREFAPWISDTEPGKAFANLRQPNQFATLCWIGVAIVLFGPGRRPRWLALAALLLLSTACAASGSRTGVVGGLGLVTLALVLPGPQRALRLQRCAIAVVAYAVAAVSLPWLLEIFTGATADRMLWRRLGHLDGCFSRLVLWSNVLHLIALKPLAGWGWGELDYAHFDTLYAGDRFCEILDNAHNLPLHLAVELGIPVAAAVCGAALWWAWRQRPWAEAEPQRQLAWAVLALILIHSMLEYPLWYGPFQIAFGAALGWLLPAAGAGAQAARSRAAPASIAAGLLASTAYAAWDYARVSQVYLPPEQRRAAWADDTLAHVRRSWLFSGQAGFAELTLATPQRENAEWMYAQALRVLHYSPEPRVIERAIESASYLGKLDEAVLLLARYRAAFPREYEAWRQAQKLPRVLPLQGAT